MKPPPPIPHEAGLVTPTASEVAAAASIALPPRLRISTPALAASAFSVTTIARCASVAAAGIDVAPSATVASAAAHRMSASGRRVAAVAADEALAPDEALADDMMRLSNSVVPPRKARPQRAQQRFDSRLDLAGLDFAHAKCFDRCHFIAPHAPRRRRTNEHSTSREVKPMGFDEIIYEKANHVAVITLNRPARLNAWTGRMESELREAVLDSEHDDNVGAVVITGAGRAYCAGADMGALNRVADGTGWAAQE